MAFAAAPSTAISQQDRQQHDNYNREEEYLSAQRAAVEAVMIGRETLETAVRQGEQLQNAEQLADETEYTLDRATRLLRGMTWSGWWANKVSRDVEPPEYNNNNNNDGTINNDSIDYGPPKVYESVPSSCAAAAQALQNYHANLQVLESCETDEQRETCQLICDNMYEQANREVTALHRQEIITSKNAGDFPSRVQNDLKLLRVRQQKHSQHKRFSPQPTNNYHNKSALFEGRSSESFKSTLSPAVTTIDPVQAQQEDHLENMARHLDDLGAFATNLNHSLSHQSNTLESLDGKSESMLFKSNMVTRRADRLIEKKSWIGIKPEFVYNASIRHVSSQKFLAVSANNSLLLSEKHKETCIFGVWKRQGKIFGLQSKYSKRWTGQNLLGNLACSAYSFDRREEWDAGEDWSETTLLCASAGWGNGGYLLVRPEDEVLAIGGGGLQDKKKADLWCIQEHKERTRNSSGERG